MRSVWAMIAVVTATWGHGTAGVTVDLDHAVFRASDSLAYVEVFASVQRSHLKYVESEDSLRADFLLRLDVIQDTNVVLSDTFFAVDAVPRSDTPTRGQFFPHVFRFIMQPGVYAVRASLEQGQGEVRDTATDSIRVRLLTDDAISMSDIELGCGMDRSDEPSPFVKNGVFFLPNPTRFYGTDLPMFYYYAEAYGLDFDPAYVDSHVVTHRIIYSENGGLARPETRRVLPTMGPSVVLVDGFPVSTLRTGTYEIELSVTSIRSGASVARRKKFWTYRADDFQAGRVWPTSTDFQARLLEAAPDVLDVVEPDSALKLMKYLLTKEQSRQAERLNNDGKVDFVRSYWNQREQSDPGAANRYFARVAVANSRWNYLHREGWRTDRGRVYVLYGEPDVVNRSYAEPSTADHEIWQYDRLEGGVIFVFADTKGFGDLELVHSTKRGEIQNPAWSSSLPARNTRGERER